MNKRILLITAPPLWPKMPPVGVAHLKAFLRSKGIECDILDMNILFHNLFEDKIKKQWLISCNTGLEKNMFSIVKERQTKKLNGIIDEILEYDAAGFSCFKSNTRFSLELAKILKSSKRSMKIIMGGPEITRQFLKKDGDFIGKNREYFDFAVAGEGELPVLNYLTEKYESQKTAAFVEMGDLDDVPFPGYDTTLYPSEKSVPLLFSRGCVRKCLFCSERLLYKKFRVRTAHKVIEEIRYHLSKNIRYFVFHDSMINGDLKKLRELCDGIIENFGSVSWEAQFCIRDDIPENLLRKMKKSGCYNLFVGLESGCNSTLRKMNKGFSTEHALSLFGKLKNAGLNYGISIIVGYPGEAEQDFRESLDFVINNRHLIPKIEQINPFTYYDGTPADKSYDYSVNHTSLERLSTFSGEIKRQGIKHTNAFIGNLVEKE